MNHFSLFFLPILWYIYLPLLLLFTPKFMHFNRNTIMGVVALQLGNETDRLALFQFKESISNDPSGILNSWNSSTHFCNWHGITCGHKHQRVTRLFLKGYELHGSISPHIGNLSFMRNLNLVDNSFFGEIPQELTRLLRLEKLALSNNTLTGEILTNLKNFSNLKGLYLNGNNLIGKKPMEIGSFQKLQVLSIGENNLTGEVPPVIGNLSSLTILWVADSHLEGRIPNEICLLKNLTGFSVHVNNFSGTFPSCLYNMSSLTIISATTNHFDGSLPPDMFHTLPNLQFFGIGDNQISGSIPASIVNTSALQVFDIGKNHFVGQVPSLAKLQYINSINIEGNNLGGDSTKDLKFLKSLTNCSSLDVLAIHNNKFGGSLPNVVGNLSTQLTQLYLEGNLISGKIPQEIGNLIGLILLNIEYNQLEGMIPPTFRKFQKMQVLSLYGNKLSGDMPTFIGNLTQLFDLDIGQNMLEGYIPSTIANCQKLQHLYLSQNNLRGAIPSEVFGVLSLISIDLSENSLSGSLPEEVSLLRIIEEIDVSENHMFGGIPGTIGECESLISLRLQGNSFNGSMPSSLSSLRGLEYLDLSRNVLSGSIPRGLQNISFLKYFNVSFNMLEGDVPIKGVFGNTSGLAITGNKNLCGLAITGNKNLCGGIPELHLPPCAAKSIKKNLKNHKIKLIAMIISVIAFLLILVFVLTICWMRKRIRKSSSDFSTIDQLAQVSYQDLHNGTDGFSVGNLIGLGSFGSVYKGTLESLGGAIAIKILNLQKKGAHKSFIAECNALKNIRHRNLVKILTCCSSIDYKGVEFKALVYEYMSKGSLEDWLHPKTEATHQPNSLNLEQRLNVIVDIASAFYYLHYECDHPVIHCDLKPSNILLDDCMIARVSDFGLARLLPSVGVSVMQSSTTGIKGTIGYAPPEYGMGLELSIEGDMYSFGVLVLEMLTGRRPTDEMFKDGHNLHNYVKHSIPDHHFLHIVDSTILIGLEHNTFHGNMHHNIEKCLLSLLRIGISCSMESPKERISMVDVTRELNAIKSFFPTRI